MASRDVLRMAEGEVHVWHWSTEPGPERVAVLARWLSPEEAARAARFRLARHGRAFIAARGTLRELLGAYAGCGAAEVEFAYNAYGKPFLAAPGSGLQFNLSHSGGVAAAALTMGWDVGLDVEREDRAVDLKVADSHFSAYEIERLYQLPEAERRAAFFRVWTRKEAFVKAQGQGLSLPLAGFDVTVGPAEPAALLRCAWDETAPARWRLADLSASLGCPAAVAVASRAGEIRVFSQERRNSGEEGGFRPL